MTTGDWRSLRSLRLEALADAPTAFETTLDQALAFSDDAWRKRARGLATDQLFMAFADNQPIGMAGAVADTDGRWEIISMWVHPAHRGTGVARELVKAATDHAACAGATRILRWVTVGNEVARSLYERMGFRATGRRQALPGKSPLEEQEMEQEL